MRKSASSKKLGVKASQGISKASITGKPYAQHASDKRIKTVPEYEGDRGKFICKCRCIVPMAFLPQFEPVHPKFVCGDCNEKACCLVCNKKTVAPEAYPPFESREKELETYYCKDHIGCAGPDPEWKKAPDSWFPPKPAAAESSK